MEATERTYTDRNHNGRLDPYEDATLPIEARVDDLLAQMTLAEKAGLMFHTMLRANADGSLEQAQGAWESTTSELLLDRLMSHFNLLSAPPPGAMATWHNRLQELALQTRLGIPITISSDPRHSFTDNPATSLFAGAFSLWPEPIGLAAIGDAELVQRFGDIARQEYLAVGIRVALHPMADLATEPRWGRINGSFGEDAELAARLVTAYIRGFQGPQLGMDSVACMTKHFPGGGPQKDGEDPHFPYGREQVYPGNNAQYHLIPFEAAFAAGTSQIMPYYGMPIGLAWEAVGFGFNHAVITGLLREHYGFDGIVCTDWGLLTDNEAFGMPARAWGVEHLSVAERAAKALDAGIDQFGGEACPEVIVKLVQQGRIAATRIDESARRILREKFRLGLFDAPPLDPQAAERIVGSAPFRAAGEAAQRRSIVLLKNDTHNGAPVLPLRGRPKLYVENIDADQAARYGELVDDVADAEYALLRLRAPFEPREGFLERMIHAGDLSFGAAELERILTIARAVPTIIDIYLERPAVIPELAAASAALLANFGAGDAALLDIVWGHAAPGGRLPFELPRSMEAVLRQQPDVPYDSENPLFPFGYGLAYTK